MELALYAPGLGYYSAGLEKFGTRGDFVTAPEISPLFGRCLARQIAQVLHETGGNILEFGAGSGQLAVDVLRELVALNCVPAQYFILEVSGYLRNTQKVKVDSELPADLAEKVVWLDELPAAFTGCVIGNEVLDALPAHLMVWQEDEITERGLAWEDDRFIWRDRPLTAGPLLEVAQALPLPAGYVSEVSLAARGLVSTLAAMLERGVVLLVDYGFPRREYYHAQRDQGTLMCHYRHQAHADPLLNPGLQDITVHVDFTAMAEAAVENGASLLGYASQAAFLINCGITELLTALSPADPAYIKLAAQAQKLLSPAEMGELFKALAYGKGMTQPLIGFAHGDARFKL